MRKQLMIMWVLILLTVAFALLRPFVGAGAPLTVGGSYRAFAHLFVGFLFGAYFVERHRLYLILALGLTALEAAVAVFVRVF